MNPLRSTAVLIATVLVGACTGAGTPGGHTTTSAAPAADSATQATAAPRIPACVTQTYDAMTADQRIGTLFMVGVPVADPVKARAQARAAVRTYHAGGLFLAGRSHASVTSVAGLTKYFQGLVTTSTTDKVALLVATDQEGGKVQVLQGPGFGAIPTALVQGTYGAATLRAKAKTWGRALAKGGVNLDLAPVADVPVEGGHNPPVGGYDREYGFTTTRVTAKASAFAAGLSEAGVDPAWKHFPGLGRVTANTDTTANVHDKVTTVTSILLDPFRAAVRGGAPWMMVSLATYDRIDPSQPAAYSPKVITSLLRGRLGFNGVVVSDALGAKSAGSLPVGKRAAALISAGGDVALTVEISLLAPMVAGVRAKAAASASFRAHLRASVLRVLTAKSALGLVPACR